MDALHVVPGRPDTLAEAVASRLRGYLAERRISHKDFGEMVGWDRGKYQRRLAGGVALDLQDLEDIERNTPLTVAFLLTGVEEIPPKPPGTRSGPPRQSQQVAHLRPVVENTPPPLAYLDEVDEDAAAYVHLAEGNPEPPGGIEPPTYSLLGKRSRRLIRTLYPRRASLTAA